LPFDLPAKPTLYKLLLTTRYLRRKLIPWFALAAVTLCVAMLIIVLSIMGGFHDLLLQSGTKLMGDVRIWAGAQGIREYQTLLKEVRKLPEAQAAAPTIETWGLLKNPSGASVVVEVVGIDPAEQSRITSYFDTIYWDKAAVTKLEAKIQAYRDELTSLEARIESLLEEAMNAKKANDQARQQAISKELGDLRDRLLYVEHAFFGADRIVEYFKNRPEPAGAAQSLVAPEEGSSVSPPMVVGIEVNSNNARADDGTYDHLQPWVGRRLALTLVPVTEAGDFADRSVQTFEVVNEMHSGLFDVDSKRVYVPFATAQAMLLMDEAEQVNPQDPLEVIGIKPARASAIIIKAAPGVSVEELQVAVRKCHRQLLEAGVNVPRFVNIDTWQDLLGDLLNTVKNEKNLMAFLFGIISFVTVLLVLVIFYMIVLEKTRDIGILRALGASRLGVASIFLQYAAVIGALGSAMGTLLGYLIVTNINEIHAWLGDWFGIVIWDRKVYFFEYIPSRVDWQEIGVIATGRHRRQRAGRADPRDARRARRSG
jgi:lipoprotein-releasing system permease protein